MRIVNLIRVAGKNDFCAIADAGDNRLDFQRCQVLRLVNHHKLVGNAAPANIAQSFHDNRPRAH